MSRNNQGPHRRSIPVDPEKDAELKRLVSKVREEFKNMQTQRFASNRKGGNPPRRQALGRGLSALMSSTAVSVDNVGPESPTSGITSQEIAERNVETPDDVVSLDEQKGQTYSAGMYRVPDSEPATFVDGPSTNLDGQSISLIPAGGGESAEVSEFESEEADRAFQQISYIGIDKVVPNKSQPRKHFSGEEINSLAESIRSTGMLQPILVRSLEGEGAFEIIAGERRYRAAKKVGLTSIPVIIRELSDKETLEVAIVENIQRQNLNPIEEAQAYRRLIEDFGESQADIAKCVGKDRVSIANSLRLLALPDEVQNLLLSGAISAGHGRAILIVKDTEKQILLARKIVDDSLSVRSVEAIAAKVNLGFADSYLADKTNRGPSNRIEIDPAVAEVEARLRRHLGTKVSVKANKTWSGEIRISFFSKDDLDGLLDRFNC